MKIEALIQGLGEAAAYPWHPPDAKVELVQTHISAVFLVGHEVFKIHKPVDFGFLDFTTIESRRLDCWAEVEINRPLAPGIYRGVAAIVEREGRLQVVRPDEESGEPELAEGEEAIEWAVWMRRLPESATFRSMLERGSLARPHLWSLAATLAEFYRAGAAHAAAHPELARLGDLDTVTENVRENFAQLDAMVDEARHSRREPPLDRDLVARLQRVTEAELARVRALIHERHQSGKIRETHGDLRLDHVYHLASASESEPVSQDLLEATKGHELLIIDRIEFAERFRWADPIADVAFLIMDLHARGAWQLGSCFAHDYIAASDDQEGAELLAFYTGYRATVRAKVAAMTAFEAELGREAQAAARRKAAARARLALVELSRPRERPCLVLVAGLPGSGKSVLARALRETAGLTWIRSDELRKRLAGLDPLARGEPDELYTPEWTDRTYDACLARAAEVCQAGGRALVDATFIDGQRRRDFVEAAIEWGVPVHMLVVHAEPELIRERLAAREGDPSDADWAVYQQARERWDPVDPALCRFDQIDASGTPREVISEATRALAKIGLV